MVVAAEVQSRRPEKFKNDVIYNKIHALFETAYNPYKDVPEYAKIYSTKPIQ